MVYRGTALGVFSDYDRANKEQIRQIFGGKLRGFADDETAHQADKDKSSSPIQAEGTRLVSIYTDGSYTQIVTEHELPALAGWGYVAIDRESEVTVETARGSVSLDPMHVAFRGATLKSNNTGELTAIGEALTWIKSTPYTPERCHAHTNLMDLIFKVERTVGAQRMALLFDGDLTLLPQPGTKGT
eukprot:gene3840-biopygen4131